MNNLSRDFVTLNMDQVKNSPVRYYPTFWQAANLVVLYIFIQTLIDFPLALYDYQKGTDLLYDPWIKVPVFFFTTVFILYLGYRYTGLAFGKVFPFKSFNLLVIPAMVLTLEGLQYFLNEITTRMDAVLPPPGWFIELFERLFESDLGVWGGVVRIVIIAPVVEELIFRGVIMSGFMRNYKIWYAITFSALMFALFHLNPWQFPATFLLGLALGWIRYRTGSVLACIAGHAIHNGLIYITVSYYQAFQDIKILQPDLPLNYLLHGFLLISGLYVIFLVTKPFMTRPQVIDKRQ
jgi:membrane protease YdiL (CAAX protease family)